jgi:hypothetical protein
MPGIKYEWLIHNGSMKWKFWTGGNEDNELGNVSKVLTFDSDNEPLTYHQYVEGTDFGWTFHRGQDRPVRKLSMEWHTGTDRCSTAYECT